MNRRAFFASPLALVGVALPSAQAETRRQVEIQLPEIGDYVTAVPVGGSKTSIEIEIRCDTERFLETVRGSVLRAIEDLEKRAPRFPQ